MEDAILLMENFICFSIVAVLPNDSVVPQCIHQVFLFWPNFLIICHRSYLMDKEGGRQYLCFEWVMHAYLWVPDTIFWTHDFHVSLNPCSSQSVPNYKPSFLFALSWVLINLFINDLYICYIATHQEVIRSFMGCAKLSFSWRLKEPVDSFSLGLYMLAHAALKMSVFPSLKWTILIQCMMHLTTFCHWDCVW